MAKRDINVVVSATTDAASFQKAEQQTRGFFARLRGGGGSSGDARDQTALQQSQAILGKAAAITATFVAAKQVLNILSSAGNMFAARAAEARGDIEAAATAWAKSIEVLRSGTITGPFVQMAEAFESLVGIETLSEVEKKQAAINAKQAEAQARQETAARQRIALLEKARDINVGEFRDAERMRVEATGNEGDIQAFNIRQSADADLKRIALLEAEARKLDEIGEKNEILASLQTARERVERNAAAEIEQADQKRIAAIDEQIAAMRKASDVERRLFGKEGAALEIEQIKLRTEARKEEIQKLIKAAETEKQRLELARLLADVQSQGQAEIAAVEPDKPQDKPIRIERPGLASAQEGLLMTGIAAAAQANQAIERQKQKTSEDTAKNTKETASILAELLRIWQSGNSQMPILN